MTQSTSFSLDATNPNATLVVESRTRRRLSGIVLMLIATALFSLMHAATKSMVPYYSSWQLTALRGMASMPFVLVWLCASGGIGNLFAVRWPLHLLRGVAALVTVGGVTFALKALPLADAYALSFAAPLLVTVFSVLWLRECVDAHAWLAVIAGLVGVLIVLRPTGEPMLTFAGLAMLASAAGYAVSVLLVRVLVRTDSLVNIVFWVTLLLSLGAGLLAIPGWQVVQSSDIPLLAGIGFAGTLGQYAVTLALRHAPASVIAPFEYTALIWALALDWTLWGARPDAQMLGGTAVIVLSGLYLIGRERQGGGRG